MKFSSSTPPNTNIFKQAIIKSLNENKQLVFSKKLTISQICQNKYKTNEEENIEFPLVEISGIKVIIDVPNSDDKLTGQYMLF